MCMSLRSTHPVVLQQRGVPVFAGRLLHKQFLTRGLVLVQHALPRIDHPVGGEEVRREGEPGVRWFIVFALVPLTTRKQNSGQKRWREGPAQCGAGCSHVPEGTCRQNDYKCFYYELMPVEDNGFGVMHCFTLEQHRLTSVCCSGLHSGHQRRAVMQGMVKMWQTVVDGKCEMTTKQ